MFEQKMNDPYFSADDNLKDLVAQMPDPHRGRYDKCGHHRIVPAFKDRVFIVFKPTGKHGLAGSDAIVVDIVRVVSIACNFNAGVFIELENQNRVRQVVSYVPNALYSYRIYISIPSHLDIRWDAREHNGLVLRSLACAMLIKAPNKADFRSVGNTYMETPNEFRRLFPEASEKLVF